MKSPVERIAELEQEQRYFIKKVEHIEERIQRNEQELILLKGDIRE